MDFKPYKIDLYEVLPPEVYQQLYVKHGEKLWRMFPIRVRVTLDRMRVRYGKCTINTWRFGGTFRYRGYRPLDCPEGSEISMHKFFQAIDCVYERATPDEIRAEIIQKPELPAFEFLGGFEKDVGWMHLDFRHVYVSGPHTNNDLHIIDGNQMYFLCRNSI